MTSWYLPRLKVSRMRSATPQMKLTISLWFKCFSLALRPVPIPVGMMRVFTGFVPMGLDRTGSLQRPQSLTGPQVVYGSSYSASVPHFAHFPPRDRPEQS